MKIKCPQCKSKIDRKSQYCQYCNFEVNPAKKDSKETNQFTENTQTATNKTAFVTEGEVFSLSKGVCVLGIAIQELKVGDVLLFNDYKLKISRIDLFKDKNVKKVESGNCCLFFNKINDKKFKKDVYEACERFSETNKPIYFTQTPTTKYVFFNFEQVIF